MPANRTGSATNSAAESASIGSADDVVITVDLLPGVRGVETRIRDTL
jgi:hypothetical protein